MLFVVMHTPNTMVAQNIGEWQESCDSSGVGNTSQQSIRQTRKITPQSHNVNKINNEKNN